MPSTSSSSASWGEPIDSHRRCCGIETTHSTPARPLSSEFFALARAFAARAAWSAGLIASWSEPPFDYLDGLVGRPTLLRPLPAQW